MYTRNLDVPADRHHHGVVFDFFELASVHESLQHRLPCVKTLHALGHRQNNSKLNMWRWRLKSQWKCTHCRKVDDERPYQEGGRHVNEQAVLIQDVDEGQIVSHSNLIVIMVMGWCDFDSAWIENGAERHRRQRREKKGKKPKLGIQSGWVTYYNDFFSAHCKTAGRLSPPVDVPTCSEAHVHKVIKDYWHLAVTERVQHHFSLQMLISGVSRVDSDSSVSKHRLNTGCCHDHFLI